MLVRTDYHAKLIIFSLLKGIFKTENNYKESSIQLALCMCWFCIHRYNLLWSCTDKPAQVHVHTHTHTQSAHVQESWKSLWVSSYIQFIVGTFPHFCCPPPLYSCVIWFFKRIACSTQTQVIMCMGQTFDQLSSHWNPVTNSLTEQEWTPMRVEVGVLQGVGEEKLWARCIVWEKNLFSIKNNNKI